jgi:hypothetical protein
MMFKIAFLFLTFAHIFHEEYWRDFFAGHEGNYTIYVHAKNGSMRESFFKKYMISSCVPTKWEYTMAAQVALLREALKDPENQKFVFLSESTVPLQGFDTVYSTLMKHPHSQFYTTANPHIQPGSPFFNSNRMVVGVPFDKQQKHSQWIVLNRPHAQLIVENSHYLNNPTFCDNEHVAGTLISLYNRLSEVVLKDTTYVNWDNRGRNGRTPFTFSDLHNATEKSFFNHAVHNDFLFARKFEERCDLRPVDYLLPYRQKGINSHSLLKASSEEIY